MKKIFSSLWVCILLCILVCANTISVSAEDNLSGTFGADNLSWSYKDNELTISGYGKIEFLGWTKDAIYPWDNLNVKSIVIEYGITCIDTGTFIELDELKTITIPVSVTEIGSTVFSKKLTTLDIYYSGNNADWTYIKKGTGMINGAGYSLSNFDTTIHYGKNNVDLSASGKCGDEAYWNLDADGTLTISGKGMIGHCYAGSKWSCPRENVKKLVIEDGITYIGALAFDYYCKNLESVVMADSVQVIDLSAFGRCSRLETIKLSKNLRTIEASAFKDCGNLLHVYYDNTKENWNKINIKTGNEALLGASIHYAGDNHNINDDYNNTGTVNVYVNGLLLKTYQPAIIVNGRTFVPLRAICEELRCEVTWNNKTQTAQIQNDVTIISVQINNYQLTKADRGNQSNIKTIEIDAPPIIYNSRTLVPVRAISEALYANVEWDDVKKRVYITMEYDSIDNFYGGIAIVKKDEKYGIINEKRELIVPTEYEWITPIDDDGYPTDSFEKYGLIKVSKESGSGFVDASGKVLAEPIYSYMYVDNDWNLDFNEHGLIRVQNGRTDKWGYLNTKGNAVVPIVYDEVEDFENGYVVVKKDGKYGHVDTAGEVVVPVIYDYAWDFSGGRALVEKDNERFYIDNNGNKIRN